MNPEATTEMGRRGGEDETYATNGKRSEMKGGATDREEREGGGVIHAGEREEIQRDEGEGKGCDAC